LFYSLNQSLLTEKSSDTKNHGGPVASKSGKGLGITKLANFPSNNYDDAISIYMTAS
jgi:hypothetical protein